MCNIIHHDVNLFRIPAPDTSADPDTMSIVDGYLRSYLHYDILFSNTDVLHPTLASELLFATAKVNDSSHELLSSIDKVHKRVCVHSHFSDIKILLQRNNLRYLADSSEKCSSCLATSLPKKSRKVSLAEISREFNEIVYVDHFSLTTSKFSYYRPCDSIFCCTVTLSTEYRVCRNNGCCRHLFICEFKVY